jgi:hypothetical protein
MGASFHGKRSFLAKLLDDGFQFSFCDWWSERYSCEGGGMSVEMFKCEWDDGIIWAVRGGAEFGVCHAVG